MTSPQTTSRRRYAGLDALAVLRAIDLRLPLTDIYADVDFLPSAHEPFERATPKENK